MLAQPVLSSFVSNSLPGRVLSTGILPLNNNPSLVECPLFQTSLIVDEATPVAFGIFNKCSNKQAYCMVGEVAEKYARHSCEIEKSEEDSTERHSVYKLKSSLEGPIDKSGERPYYQVFGDDEKQYLEAHLADVLFDQSVGCFNMDMEKNFTIDLIGDDKGRMDIWRDRAGFLVSDNMKLREITASKEDLLSIFSAASINCSANIVKVGKENIESVLEVDDSITLYQRSAFINYLISHEQVRGFVALGEDGSALGYSLATADRVLLCYSEDADVAAKLLSTVVSTSPADEITFFTHLGVNPAIDAAVQKASKVEKVTRLHTRTKAMQVKWPKVHVANVGLSLF